MDVKIGSRPKKERICFRFDEHIRFFVLAGNVFLIIQFIASDIYSLAKSVAISQFRKIGIGYS